MVNMQTVREALRLQEDRIEKLPDEKRRHLEKKLKSLDPDEFALLAEANTLALAHGILAPEVSNFFYSVLRDFSARSLAERSLVFITLTTVATKLRRYGAIRSRGVVAYGQS